MVKDLIYIEEFRRGDTKGYMVYYENGVHIGEFYMEIDGYWVFEQKHENSGYWNAHVLRGIADKLDELNAPYEDEVIKYFESKRNETVQKL